MHRLEKLFDEILLQLQSESKKYKKLKICKYSFEISKVCILSLATGLSFIKYFCYFIYNINTSNRYYKKYSKCRSTYCYDKIKKRSS